MKAQQETMKELFGLLLVAFLGFVMAIIVIGLKIPSKPYDVPPERGWKWTIVTNVDDTLESGIILVPNWMIEGDTLRFDDVTTVLKDYEETLPTNTRRR